MFLCLFSKSTPQSNSFESEHVMNIEIITKVIDALVEKESNQNMYLGQVFP